MALTLAYMEALRVILWQRPSQEARRHSTLRRVCPLVLTCHSVDPLHESSSLTYLVTRLGSEPCRFDCQRKMTAKRAPL